MTTLDYFDIILSDPKMMSSMGMYIAGFFLAMARIIPVIMMSYFIASKSLPMPVRYFLGVGLFLYMLPSIIFNVKTFDMSFSIIGYFFKELFVGVLLGMLISVPHYIVTIAGMVIDQQRGASNLMSTNPILSSQDSPLGILFNYFLTYVYWMIGVPFLYFETIAQSFVVFPIDTFLPPILFDVNSYTLVQFQGLIATMFKLGIQLAAPSLIVLLIIDMFLGICNRLAPQVMITFLAQGLKSMLGISMVCVGWYLIINLFDVEATSWAKELLTWIYSLET
jgi:type III secretion protein T